MPATLGIPRISSSHREAQECDQRCRELSSWSLRRLVSIADGCVQQRIRSVFVFFFLGAVFRQVCDRVQALYGHRPVHDAERCGAMSGATYEFRTPGTGLVGRSNTRSPWNPLVSWVCWQRGARARQRVGESGGRRSRATEVMDWAAAHATSAVAQILLEDRVGIEMSLKHLSAVGRGGENEGN